MSVELPSEIRSPLERHLNRNLLRYAVQRAIQCGKCRNVLDMRRAVLVTAPERESFASTVAVVCAPCFDASRSVLRSDVEIVDGRDVFKSAPRKPRKPAPDAIDIHVHIRGKNGFSRSKRVTAHAVNGAPFYVHRTIGNRTRWTISRACGYVADVSIAQGIKGRDAAAKIARRFWEALDENQRHVLNVHPHGAPATEETRAMGEILRRIRREIETPHAAHA